jgi:hypothetical protein
MQRRFSRSNLRNASRAGAFCAVIAALGLQAQTASAPIPNFAPDDHTSWYPDRPDGDNFLSPESGPGPIQQVKDLPYVPNAGFTTDDPELRRKYPQRGGDDFASTHPTYRIADLSNSILQPWVRDQMKKDNDEVRAGKVPFMARERCYPGGVPEFDIFRRVAPPMVFFIQTPKEVLIIWRGDSQVRHIYMNVPHSKAPKPSWYGESVGHYEGDTLVVDTIGQNTRTFVDNYRTPHTPQLHVIERFHMTEGGKRMQVDIRVEDPGAFTMPWNAVQRFALWHPDGTNNRRDGRLIESPCAESAAFDHFTSGNYGATHAAEVVQVPVAVKSDF